MTERKNRPHCGLTALEQDILSLLKFRSHYGTQILEAINEVSGNPVHLGFGSLYPTLHRLEKQGLLTSELEISDRPGARRRYYTITDEGLKALDRVDTFRAKLSLWRPDSSN